MLIDSLLKQYRLASRLIAILIVILGSTVLVGWATRNHALTKLIPSFDGAIEFAGQVHSAAALNIVLLGFAMVFVSFRNNNVIKTIGYVLSSIVIISCSLALYETISGDVLDNFRFLAISPGARGITYPTSMIPEVSLTLLILGISLCLTDLFKDRAITAKQAACLVSMIIPLLILFGAATKSPQLCALGGCFSMSLAFALLTLLIAIGSLMAEPDIGFLTLFTTNTRGAVICRKGALFLAFVPFFLILRVAAVNISLDGGKNPLINEPLSWVLTPVLLLGIGVYLVYTAATTINKADYELLEKDLEISQKNAELQLSQKALSESMKAVSENTVGVTVRYKKICQTCTEEFAESFEKCPIDGSDLSKVIDNSLVGLKFLDKYEVENLLGEGGMSTVYRATHDVLKKDFAIKVLKGNTDSDSLKRFKREAKLTSALDHENIIGVHDFGIAPDGRSYLVMEFVEGETLSDMISRVGYLKPRVARYYLLQICEALEHAHGKGIIHRDLKPANIMLVKNKEGMVIVKVVDFGLAKILDDSETSASQKITQTGECFGSPLYMSPEQCLGEKVDNRTDLYALGCIAHECLTGRPPFIGKTILETFTLHVDKEPSPIPPEFEISSQWQAAILKSLAKKRIDRQSDVSEFKNVFSQLPT